MAMHHVTVGHDTLLNPPVGKVRLGVGTIDHPVLAVVVTGAVAKAMAAAAPAATIRLMCRPGMVNPPSCEA